MAVQYSVFVRNARLDAVEATTGASALLRIRTGAPPANCATADSGVALVTISLPSDWMAAASSGSKSKLGTWTNTAAATGVAAHFRIYNSAGTTCHVQGTVTASGGGGDMTINAADASLATGQTVTVSTLTLTAANA